MLKALVTIQLRAAFMMLFNPGKSSKKRKPLGKVLIVLAVIYILGALGFSLGYYLYAMFQAFHPAGLTWFYFSLTGITAFVFSFIGSIYLAQSTLFNAKDNELLLSMPIRPGFILLSRTCVLYLLALLFQAVVLVPALVVWLLLAPVSLSGILVFLLANVLLPLPTLALSILLGWLLAQVSSRLRHKNLLIILLSLLFLGAYFFGYGKLMGAMGNLLIQGQEMAKAVQSTLFPAYHYGLAIAQPSLMSLLLYSLCCLVPFALVLLIVKANYVKVLTTRRGAPKLAYKGGGMKEGSLMKALITKELRRFFSSPVYIMNSAIGLVFMVALPFILLFDQGTLVMLKTQFNLTDELIGAAAVLAISLLASSAFISAPSISLEGKSLWILQTLPVSPIQSLLAKAAAHVLICSLPIAVSGILLGIILKLGVYQTLMSLLVPLLVSAFCALLGLELNLRFPKLDWRTETEPVKQSMSTFLAMALGFATVAGAGALYFFLLQGKLTSNLYLALAAILFALLSYAVFLHLKQKADDAYLDLSEA